jgi:hypothetical protein
MKFTIITDFPHPILLRKTGPCLSLYMPTHRLFTDESKDVIVYTQLVKEALSSLGKLQETSRFKDLEKTLLNLATDHEFWRNQKDGMALFATEDTIIIYQAQTNFKPFTVIADSFHIKPLFSYFQHQEQFHLLALEAEKFEVYQGNIHHLESLAFPFDSKVTLSEVLGSQQTDHDQTNKSYGGTFVGSTLHGHGGKKDDTAIDREKYFRYVDRFVYEHFSKHHPLPLILVTPKDHQFTFRSAAKNPHMLESMIDGSFQTIINTHLLVELTKIANLRFDKHLQRMIQTYQNQRHLLLSSDGLETVAKALMEGRVSHLFIEKDHVIPGHLNLTQQKVMYWDLNEPHTDDVLDDMLQLAMTKGTSVYLLDKSKMPTQSGVAANFRY